MTVPGQLPTSDLAPPDDAATSGATGTAAVQVRADSGITRLAPADGLFLRAEHLVQMQDYARDLTQALGVATGSGVIHGFRAVLDGDTLQVGAGLAVTTAGRPLRTRQTVPIPLRDLIPACDRFWVLEVAEGVPRPFGEENVYGSVCDDPCDASSRLRPWLDEGVTVRLVTDAMPGLDTQSKAVRRNLLASWYFERERRRSGPWLTPTAPGAVLSRIVDRDWAAGTDAPTGGAVPLAVLVRLDDQWLLDVWTARRDIGDPHPVRAWQARLAMRPWDVFVAQVLQFQEQLAQTTGSPPSGAMFTPSPSPWDDERVQALVNAVLSRKVGMPKQMTATARAIQNLGPADVTIPGASLLDLGFRELPPAGYLTAAPDDEKDPQTYYETVFGCNVDVTVCQTSADAVPRLIESARHLDRIPLEPAEPRPRIAVLVPSTPADLAAVQAGAYRWVAFTRWRDMDCGRDVRIDEVDVYHLWTSEQDPNALSKRLGDSGNPEGEQRGVIQYPDGIPVRLPGVDVAPLKPEVGSVIFATVALTHVKGRVGLAQTRAAGLVAEFAPGVAGIPSVAVASDKAEREAIILMLRAVIG